MHTKKSEKHIHMSCKSQFLTQLSMADLQYLILTESVNWAENGDSN